MRLLNPTRLENPTRLARLAGAAVLAAGLGLVTAVTASGGPPARAQDASCPWVGSTAPIATRVSEVLARMTLAEKISMAGGTSSGPYVGNVAAIPSLCVPALNLEDGPAGVADGMTGVTQLPAPVAAAATWDSADATRYGDVIGAEEAGKGANVNLGPTVNIVRDPRWGRAFEALSEDPYLTGQLGAAEIKGVQSQGVLSQVKHLAVYNQETNRNTAADNAIVSERAMQEIYLPAFQAAIDSGGAASVMCSYSTINGTYACQNPYTLTQVLRDQFGFKGFVTSDWGATHSTVGSAQAGLDMQMPDNSDYGAPLQAAVQDGQVPLSTLNAMAGDILTEMFRFGLFDRAPSGSPAAVVTTARHAAIARDVAAQGTVLLKNDGNVLPVDASTVKSVAVIGDDASTSVQSAGGGSAGVTAPYVVSPLAGITSRAGSGVAVSYAPTDVSEAVAAAKSADVAVVFASDFESEGSDLSGIDLPSAENQVISAVAAANPNTIVVLNTGSAVTMPWLSQVKGVLEAWYPGQEDGNAIASVLFGDVNPSGHLPVTFPRSLADVPASTTAQWPGTGGQVQYSEGVDVGYRWYDAKNIAPLFPFGFGLSYTRFTFSHITVTPGQTTSRGTVAVSADVTNTGKRAGADVAQLYVGDPASTGEPPEQLKGYAKVSLTPGQTKRVSFRLPAAQAFSSWDPSAHGWAVADGSYKIMIGDSAASPPLTATARVTRSYGPQGVSLGAPSVVTAGSAQTVSATFSNADSDVPARNVTLRLSAPAGWTVQPASVKLGTVAAHAAANASFHVSVPSGAPGGSSQLTGTASYVEDQVGPASVSGSASVTVPYPSLSAAYDDAGVSDDSDPAAGNFDGGGYSYSAQALASAGVTPGAAVSSGGFSFTWPDVPAGQPENVTLNGQIVNLSGSGSELALLGAGAFGTQTGQVTVQYTDGTTSAGTITLSDWYADAADPGDSLVATAPYWNEPAGSTLPKDHMVSLYLTTVLLTAGKTVARVTFPSNPDMHVFAYAIGSLN
jgi:beta-glucosidase